MVVSLFPELQHDQHEVAIRARCNLPPPTCTYICRPFAKTPCCSSVIGSQQLWSLKWWQLENKISRGSMTSRQHRACALSQRNKHTDTAEIKSVRSALGQRYHVIPFSQTFYCVNDWSRDCELEDCNTIQTSTRPRPITEAVCSV